MSLKHLLLGAALLCAPLAVAQSPAPSAASSPICTGTLSVVRISEIKPGKLDGFMAAIAAQEAWYHNNGATDQFYTSRVMEQDPATKHWRLTDTQIMTIHVESPNNKTLPLNDTAWKAFVQKFRDSSDIKTEYRTCSTTPAS